MGAPVKAIGICAALASALLLSPATGADFEDRGLAVGADGVITRSNLGADEAWPLRIKSGTFVCIEDAVFISDGTTEYPLNGRAQALTRSHPQGRRPLEDIWLADEKTLTDRKAPGVKLKMVRFSISPVLNRGVKWCRVRRS